MLQLQMYVNQFTTEFDAAIAETFELSTPVDWVSPLAKHRYAEYRDDSFLRSLGLAEHLPELLRFWPTGGPCWDALGIARDEDASLPVPLLVEAKSYPGEGFSSLAARSPSSIATIEAALSTTAHWLGLNALPPSWTRGRYQTANRIAHLYWFREVLRLNARLVFVLIVGDPTNNPTGREDWESAWQTMWNDLELAEPPPGTGALYLRGRHRTPPAESVASQP